MGKESRNEKASRSMKAVWANPEYHARVSRAIAKGVKNKKVQAKRAASLRVFLNTPDGKAKWSEVQKRLWNDSDFRIERSKAIKVGCALEGRSERISEGNKKAWKDPAIRAKRLSSILLANQGKARIKKIGKASLASWASGNRKLNRQMASPNNSEIKLDTILQKYFPGLFSFNVKKGVRIGGKTPDFLNTDEKAVVELFGDYWHGQKMTGHSERVSVARRRDHFRKYGYECVVIWGSELLDTMKIVKRVIMALDGKR